MNIVLFLFGSAVGSFLNVIALRYDPDRFLLDERVVGGRSRCPKCKRTLEWFELIPVLSFVIQRARCRACRSKISPQYLVSEVLAGLIFVFVPATLGCGTSSLWCGVEGFLWTAVFAVLLLIALVDIRLFIIPDELVALLAALGACLALFAPGAVGTATFLGLPTLGLPGRALGAVLAAIFFGTLIAITRGRGMGIGDLKLGAALGMVFGWPGVLGLIFFSFVIGGACGVFLLGVRRSTMRSAVPFGPFLALGSAAVFFFGKALLEFYLLAFLA
jgi:prepilin signal peptidase PulO-like enzyme (type II secretory pathway)